MKRLFLFALFVMTMLMLSCTTIDNYTVPSEKLSGRLIDKTTGEVFVTEQPNGFRIRLLEISWSDTPQPEYFWGKADGTFNNSKIFKGTYEVTPVEGAFFDVDPKIVEIEGNTCLDFEVLPFLRIEALKVERITRGSLEVSYKIIREIAADKIIDARVFVSTNPNVGSNIIDSELSPMKDFSEIDDREVLSHIYTEKIEGLKENKTYYIRIGARTNNSNKRYNFSKTFKLE